MKVVATFSPPSSVKCSLKCRLANDVEHLVVAKLSRLDIYSLQPEGLAQECGLELWGNVVSIKAIPIPVSSVMVAKTMLWKCLWRLFLQGARRSNLLVLTDHPDPELFFLSYRGSRSGAPELVTTKHLSLYERSPRPAEFFTGIVMDEFGEYAMVSCYASKLKCLVFQNGGYGQDFDIS
jgi:DNA damage-binding protein 1